MIMFPTTPRDPSVSGHPEVSPRCNIESVSRDFRKSNCPISIQLKHPKVFVSEWKLVVDTVTSSYFRYYLFQYIQVHYPLL